MDLSILTSLEVLLLTIYGEARGEPIEGQIAVGCVIRNRLHASPERYHNLSDVCLEPKQFSCWNEDDQNRVILIEVAQELIMGQVPTDSIKKQCLWVAKGIIDWSIIDNVKGNIHYMSKGLFTTGHVDWAKNAKNILQKGNQIFFNI